MGKTLKLTGWTNHPVRVQKELFKSGVVSSSCAPEYNPYTFHVCTPEMKTECERRKGCQGIRTQCKVDMEYVLGYEVPSWGNPGARAIRDLKRIKKEALQGCKKILVTIAEAAK